MPETCTDYQAAEKDSPGVTSCAVMVSSCDAYSDLWEPFFALFWKHWPDCPFPVYLGANQQSYQHPRVRTLNIVDESWSKSLKRFLQQIETEYVLFLMEDFFLDRRVDTGVLLRNLAALHTLNGTVLRIFPNPGPELPLASQKEIGVIPSQALYRVSAQPAFWNRQKLIELLREEESAWEFEWKGTQRSQASEGGYYATYRPLLSYRHVVERGEWFWAAARRYKGEQIGCDFKARPVMGPFKAVKKAANRLRKDVWNALAPLDRRIQS